jgi:biopolymer transport protein ExbD
MKMHRMPDVREGGVNVTPLIDVVMCLIIFYMLIAKIGVDTGADVNINIPASLQGVSIKDMGNTLTLNVIAGPLDQPMVTALVGNVVAEVKLIDPVSGQKPLLNTLQKYRKDNAEFKVIIRGDEDMGYKFLEPVLITCAEARVKNVNFNTRMVTKPAETP